MASIALRDSVRETWGKECREAVDNCAIAFVVASPKNHKKLRDQLEEEVKRHHDILEVSLIGQ